MSERAPYSRVYWQILEDPKFDGIRDNERTIGAWLLMLVAADMAYPAPAYVPPVISKMSLRALVDCGLVDTLEGRRFRLHGLQAERDRRSQSARNAAALRWQSEPDANGLLGKAEAETRRGLDEAEAPRASIADDPADTYWRLTGKFPGERPLSWIDDLAGRFGAEAVSRAIATAYIADRSTQTLLGRAQDNLRAEARELDRKEKAEEQARLREKRAKPVQLDKWREEYRAAIEAQYAS